MTFTMEDAENYVAQNHWKFAKTLAHIPHEYTLKERSLDPAAFERFVLFIRANGYPKRFGKKTFIYLNIGEHQYWTMGNPLHITKLINRASIK